MVSNTPAHCTVEPAQGVGGGGEVVSRRGVSASVGRSAFVVRTAMNPSTNHHVPSPNVTRMFEKLFTITWLKRPSHNTKSS